MSCMRRSLARRPAEGKCRQLIRIHGLMLTADPERFIEVVKLLIRVLLHDKAGNGLKAFCTFASAHPSVLDSEMVCNLHMLALAPNILIRMIGHSKF